MEAANRYAVCVKKENRPPNISISFRPSDSIKRLFLGPGKKRQNYIVKSQEFSFRQYNFVNRFFVRAPPGVTCWSSHVTVLRHCYFTPSNKYKMTEQKLSHFIFICAA